MSRETLGRFMLVVAGTSAGIGLAALVLVLYDRLTTGEPRDAHAVFWHPLTENSLREKLPTEILAACVAIKAMRARASTPTDVQLSSVVAQLAEWGGSFAADFWRAKPKLEFTISEVVDLLGPPDYSFSWAKLADSESHKSRPDKAAYMAYNEFGDFLYEFVFWCDPATGLVDRVSALPAANDILRSRWRSRLGGVGSGRKSLMGLSASLSLAPHVVCGDGGPATNIKP